MKRFLAVLFLKNMELAWNEDDADVIISKPNVSCKEECDQYLSIPAISAKSGPLVWWQQNQDRFPHVAKMARQHLGVPATSASVERVFSGVGLTFSDHQERFYS